MRVREEEDGDKERKKGEIRKRVREENWNEED